MKKERRENLPSGTHWIDDLRADYPAEQIERMTDQEVEDLIVAAQISHLYKRAPGKYEKITKAVRYISYLAPAVEVSYHVFRFLDDVLDGDTSVPDGFSGLEEWIDHIGSIGLSEGESTPKETSVEFLMKRMFEKTGDKSTEVARETAIFMEVAYVENITRNSGRLFSKQELVTMYNRTISPSENIVLIGMGSRARVKDVPEFSQIPGRAFNLSTLETGVARGEFNIPKEVIEDSGLSPEELSAKPELVWENEVVRQWISQEIRFIEGLIKNLNSRKKDLRGWLVTWGYTFAIKMFDLASLKKRLKETQ